MPAACKNAFDVAFWFLDMGLDNNEYIQPQKLHRLMYLAQAYFAVAYPGKRLMPACFVADDMGPIEPNIYIAFSQGRPRVEVEMHLEPHVQQFLESIWRRFGHHSAQHLTKLTTENKAYRAAHRRGPRGVISFAEMRKAFQQPETGPDVSQVVRSRVMRSQTGKPVAVRTWIPGAKT